MQGAKMAEDAFKQTTEDGDDEAVPLVVPSHDPLPPPPDFSYTRPTLGKAAPLSEQNRTRSSGTPAQSAPSSLNLGTGMSAGITLASSVVVGFLIGQWIDHYWHLSTPWGTIIFALTGVVAGFLNLFRILGASDDHRKK